MSILVVDDSQTQRAALADILRAARYEVDLAASAVEGLDRLRCDSRPAVDLILMDLHMPDLDGIEACRRIRGLPACGDLPVIMVTSSHGTDHLQRAFAAGAIDYITKPPNETELLARVRSALRLKVETDRRKARERELGELNERLRWQAAELRTAREALLDLNRQLERRVEQQVHEIRQRAREVDALNVQVRAQVQARSRELASALQRLSDPATRPPLLVPGTELGGRVRIERRLVVGGMGEIYLAEDLLVGQYVVVKVLRQAVGRDLQDLHRFIEEAAAAASVDHPAIVKTLHIDVSPDGRLYQVMEYVAGTTLEECLADGPLGAAASVSVGAVIAAALAAAHEAGVIHRDIKPSNLILCTSRPGVRVLDFGISKMRRSRAEQRRESTRAGLLLGTPAYMPPEQIRDAARVTPAADVYSLGAVLFEAITGRPVFAERDLHALVAAHTSEPAPDVRELAGGVPADLAGLIGRCLAKDPEARPSSVVLTIALSRLAAALDAPPAEAVLAPPGARTTGHALSSAAKGTATHDAGARAL